MRKGYDQPPSRKIVGYNVDQAPDGSFIETPIYAELAPTAHIDTAQDHEDDLYDASTTYDETDDMHEQEDQPAQSPAERKGNPKSTSRGNPLAKAAFILAGMTTVIYGTDVGVTYIKDAKVISPVDAYKDLTELPGFVKPTIDTAQSVIKFVSGKKEQEGIYYD